MAIDEKTFHEQNVCFSNNPGTQIQSRIPTTIIAQANLFWQLRNPEVIISLEARYQLHKTVNIK